MLAVLPSLRRLVDAEDDLAGPTGLEAVIRHTAREDIHDGKETAPSKRLLKHVRGFPKTLHGPLATEDAGLPTLRAQCPRLHAWMERLESLSTSKGPADT